MEIIDTLTSFPNKSPYFSVDITETSAVLSNPADPVPYLVNASGQNQFQAGDNFTLLSAGIFIPYSFSPYVISADAAVSNRLKLEIVDGDGNVYSLPELGADSKIHIPLENYETALGIFIPVLPKARRTTGEILTGPFYIRYAIEGLIISLIGCPRDFDTKEIPVFPYIKVLHNLPLATGTPAPSELVADFTYELVPLEE
jgi:hypothetical protein